MAPPRRASSWAFGRAFGAAALALCALGAGCRQTVLLDPAGAEGGAGSGGGGGGGLVLDSGTDAADKPGNGGMGGSNRFDGGRPDLGFCFTNTGPLLTIPISMRTPDLIVSVDRSSNMQTWFGSGTRLEVIQQQVQALASKYRGVKFGYEEFPATMSMCGTQGCCAGDVALPNYNNRKAIDRVIHACDMGGAGCSQPQRPIADALSKVGEAYKNLFSPDDPGHRYVVLLTSGDPACMGSDATSACKDAVAEVTKLSRSFTNTAIFGVGDGSDSSCLDMMALYGGLGDSHIVKTPNDLSSALDSVVEIIAEESCKIDVRMPPSDLSKVQLLIEGIPIPSDPVDGWTFDQDTNVTLTVHGSYCRALVQTGARVQLVMGCVPPHN